MSHAIGPVRKILGLPRRYWADLAERVGSTFVAAFVAEMALTSWSLDAASVKVAVAAALVSTIKGSLASLVGNRATASALPARVDPATPPVDGP